MNFSGAVAGSSALWALSFSFLCGVLGACGDASDHAVALPPEPADVEGDYAVDVTYGDDGCALEDWDEGSEVTGARLEIEQDGRRIEGNVSGWAGLGQGSELVGSVTGHDFTLTRRSSRSTTEDDCTFRSVVTFEGTLEGDRIEGSVSYTFETNGDPSCGLRETCTSVQEFDGARRSTK